MLWRLSKRGNPAVSSMGDWHGGLVDPCLESVEATAALAVRVGLHSSYLRSSEQCSGGGARIGDRSESEQEPKMVEN